ncbi:MAG: TetR/AcrR family transcriptional regulator [Kiritimatiellia bacterium]
MSDTQSKRRLILSAAEHMLRERRVHELTMDEVARGAGVSKGTIYRYFEDKDDLLFQLATDGFDQLCALVETVPASGDFSDCLLSVCERIRKFFSERRSLVRMINEHEGRVGCFSGAMRERWLEHRMHLVRALANLIRRGAREGGVRSDLSPEALAGLLLGMLRSQGRAQGRRPGTTLDLQQVVDIFLRGVAPLREGG